MGTEDRHLPPSARRQSVRPVTAVCRTQRDRCPTFRRVRSGEVLVPDGDRDAEVWMTVTRVGLIGAGGVAQRHARVLSGLPDAQVVAVTDVVPAAAGKLAAEYGGRAVPDVEALLGEGPDAVYICVPPFAHGTAERAVIAAGLPLFVEKPIAVNMEIAREICTLIAERDLLTAVGHHWRYLAVVEQARALLADRPVRLVSGAWLDKVPPVSWWPHRDRSGGPIVEQAAHVLDLARHLPGEVAEVTAAGNGTPPPVDGADIDGA